MDYCYFIEQSTDKADLSGVEGLHESQHFGVHRLWGEKLAQLTEGVMQVAGVSFNHMQHATQAILCHLEHCIALDAA